LKKPWNPYIRRHSSLTEKSTILKEHTLRQFAGWSPGSNMHLKYLHYFGSESNDSILEAYGIISKDEQLSDALRPKQCPNCNEPNKTLSTISNLIASTSACCIYSGKDNSYVSQVIFKTWCCCFVKFTSSLIVMTLSVTLSLFLSWVDFVDDIDVAAEGHDADSDEGLFIFVINYLSQ
jgi:hypothetical protein